MAKEEGNILKSLNDIVSDLDNQTLENVDSLMQHFCEAPIVENGVTYHPFTDPIVADKLNKRYKQLTGKNHPLYEKHEIEVIDGLLQDRELLESEGAYDAEYFDQIEKIKDSFEKDKSDGIEIVNVVASDKILAEVINTRQAEMAESIGDLPPEEKEEVPVPDYVGMEGAVLTELYKNGIYNAEKWLPQEIDKNMEEVPKPPVQAGFIFKSSKRNLWNVLENKREDFIARGLDSFAQNIECSKAYEQRGLDVTKDDVSVGEEGIISAAKSVVPSLDEGRNGIVKLPRKNIGSVVLTGIKGMAAALASSHKVADKIYTELGNRENPLTERDKTEEEGLGY